MLEVVKHYRDAVAGLAWQSFWKANTKQIASQPLAGGPGVEKTTGGVCSTVIAQCRG